MPIHVAVSPGKLMLTVSISEFNVITFLFFDILKNMKYLSMHVHGTINAPTGL